MRSASTAVLRREKRSGLFLSPGWTAARWRISGWQFARVEAFSARGGHTKPPKLLFIIQRIMRLKPVAVFCIMRNKCQASHEFNLDVFFLSPDHFNVPCEFFMQSQTFFFPRWIFSPLFSSCSEAIIQLQTLMFLLRWSHCAVVKPRSQIWLYGHY